MRRQHLAIHGRAGRCGALAGLLIAFILGLAPAAPAAPTFGDTQPAARPAATVARADAQADGSYLISVTAPARNTETQEMLDALILEAAEVAQDHAAEGFYATFPRRHTAQIRRGGQVVEERPHLRMVVTLAGAGVSQPPETAFFETEKVLRGRAR